LIIQINLDNKTPENQTNEPVEETEGIQIQFLLFIILIYLEIPGEELFDDEN
jgi:hypothetical protein